MALTRSRSRYNESQEGRSGGTLGRQCLLSRVHPNAESGPSARQNLAQNLWQPRSSTTVPLLMVAQQSSDVFSSKFESLVQLGRQP